MSVEPAPSRKPTTIHGYPCPNCGARTDVKDSRATQEGYIRRRRKCKNCTNRFTTIESLDNVQRFHHTRTVNAILAHVERAGELLFEMKAEHEP